VPAARVTVTRPLEWMDTDAAGIWHHSTTIRFIEHAEHELHRRLGIDDELSGRTPRARLEVDFRRSVRFGDDVATSLVVDAVGGSSIAYRFTLEVAGDVAAEGRIVTVLIDGDGRPAAVPGPVRRALLEAGDGPWPAVATPSR
jgi:acyl-CoA thioester hydrolase